MGFRIAPVMEAQRERKPRVEKPKHLDRIRRLPCIICGRHLGTEAAHIRAPAPHLGKRETGKSEKPSDLWTLPLCNEHHRTQHSMSEMGFWKHWEIDPHATALALWAADGDMQIMEQIIRMARQ